MKKLLFAFSLPILLFCLQIPPAGAQPAATAVCDNGTELTIHKEKQFEICWERNPEPDVDKYQIYISMTEGQVEATFGEPVDVAMACNDNYCFSGPLVKPEVGTYWFTVTALDTSQNLESAHSNEVKLVIEDRTPSKPSGCSIRLF